MKRLFYELFTICVTTPILLWFLVAPLVSMASTVGNIAGFVLCGIIILEMGSLGIRIVNKVNERIDDEKLS